MKTKIIPRGLDSSITDVMIEEPSFTKTEFIEALYNCLELSERDNRSYGIYLRPSQIGQLIAKLEDNT